MNILITGASSGIGQALAKQYLSLGHALFACGRNESRLQQLSQYGDVTPLIFDVNNLQQMRTAIQDLPELDLVILNAGDCEYIKDATKFDGQLFERIVQTNLVSLGHIIELVLPKLLASQKQPVLALIGSSVTNLPFSQAEAYGASKAGLAYLADSLYLDLKPHGIHVCKVSPGFVSTPLTDKNTFEMPFIISADKAAQRIVKGLTNYQRHIQFPKRLIWTLKLLSLLPRNWWFKLSNQAKRSTTDMTSGNGIKS